MVHTCFKLVSGGQDLEYYESSSFSLNYEACV